MPDSHAQEQFSEGLINYVELTGERDCVQLAGQAFRDMRSAFEANVGPSDVISLAFPGMIIRPDLRDIGLLAVLGDRVLVVWRKGVFKKTVQSEVIPRSAMTGVTVGKGTAGSRAGAVMLTIKTATTSAQITLSREGAAKAESLCAAITSS
ncbi:MAG TPA: hypothetical protein VHW74_04260 [Mycobacteriales bacterium]|jgi:hypothetical protein|nr:hypothetical protein [Mycobacteriales bacterium]